MFSDLSAWELTRMLITLLVGILITAIPSVILLVRARHRETRLRRQIARLTTSAALLTGTSRSGSQRRSESGTPEHGAQEAPAEKPNPEPTAAPSEQPVPEQPAPQTSAVRPEAATPAPRTAGPELPAHDQPHGNPLRMGENGSTADAPAPGPSAERGAEPAVPHQQAPAFQQAPALQQAPESGPRPERLDATGEPPTQPVTAASVDNAPEQRAEPPVRDTSAWNPSVFASEETAEKFRRDYVDPMDEHRRRLAELRTQLSGVVSERETNSTESI